MYRIRRRRQLAQQAVKTRSPRPLLRDSDRGMRSLRSSALLAVFAAARVPEQGVAIDFATAGHAAVTLAHRRCQWVRDRLEVVLRAAPQHVGVRSQPGCERVNVFSGSRHWLLQSLEA